jgi:hypothetical protein
MCKSREWHLRRFRIVNECLNCSNFSRLASVFLIYFEAVREGIDISVKQEQTKDSSFLGIGSLLGGSASLASILEETVQLSKSMSIADAVHDNKIVENVQGLKQRGSELIRELQDKLGILDRSNASELDACLLCCSELYNEVDKDVLHVATETCTKGTGFSTKSTVILDSHRIPPFIPYMLIESSGDDETELMFSMISDRNHASGHDD